MKPTVLVVDDDDAMRDTLALTLKRRGYPVATFADADAAWAGLLEHEAALVVTDLRMRGKDGLELCDLVVKNRPDVPVIVVTGFGSLDTAVATLRAGAFDFLQKPFQGEELGFAVERAAHHRQLREEVRRLRAESAGPVGELLGESAAMRELHELLGRVAPGDATVLITGESGTGKELAARARHTQSRRSEGPFVALNCAAVPEGLLESELFGHARGAFTDAKVARRGLFLEASGGTLFLDEIGDMPLGMQAKLLRALEERRVRPVGGNAEVPFDARIVAATHRDLETAVSERRFREDLYYRIHVVHIEMPPLRQRGSDVLLLAHTILARLAARQGKEVRGLSPAVAERFLAYDWPGNIRELQNCLERAVALARLDLLTVEDLPPKLRDFTPSHVLVASTDASDLVTMEEVERRYVQRVMEAVSGNKTQAARILGFDRTTLYRKLEKHGITVPEGGR